MYFVDFGFYAPNKTWKKIHKTHKKSRNEQKKNIFCLTNGFFLYLCKNKFKIESDMVNEVWYDNFIDILYKKYPKKTQLTQALIDLLLIEREAVYRRLRKDVIFPVHEVVKIASAWNLSLDEITGVDSEHIPFKMRKMNYVDPTDDESNFLRVVIAGINYCRSFPSTEFMDICNKLPRQLSAGFEYLNQFYLFKWRYQYGTEKETLPYSQTVISEEKRRITSEYYAAIKNVPNTNFIFDRMLFDYLVGDIRYFYSIRLITEEEKQLIKKDLHNMLEYLLDVASMGYYPETRNKVNIYISQLNVDTNYNYVFTPEANICFVHAFEKYEIFTFNTEMVTNFRNWMQLKKKSSIQISEVDERSRVEYFTKQHQLIDSL